jgi:hypothetical protein
MRWWCYIFVIYFGCASEWELSRWDGEANPTTPRHEAFPANFNTSATYAKARRQTTFQTGWKSPHCTKSLSISRPFAQATNCTSPEITAGSSCCEPTLVTFSVAFQEWVVVLIRRSRWSPTQAA